MRTKLQEAQDQVAVQKSEKRQAESDAEWWRGRARLAEDQLELMQKRLEAVTGLGKRLQ